MEKCPPAEACRDAFERMSKATVKMCLSTNGFGSSAHLSSSKPLNVSGRPRNAGFDQFGNQVSNIRDRDRAPPTLSAPVSSELSTTPSHTNSNHPPALQHGRPVEYSRGYGSLNLPKQLSPVQSHAIAHTSPFTNIQQHVYTTSAPSQGPQYPYSSEPPVTQPPYSAPPDVTLPNLSDQDFRYLPEFDFLNLAPQQLNPELSCNATGATNIGGTNAPEMGMFSMSSPFGNNGDPSDETGVNLGYGFSVDLQHDWSETANYDLFGEFFFGNGTGGT